MVVGILSYVRFEERVFMFKFSMLVSFFLFGRLFIIYRGEKVSVNRYGKCGYLFVGMCGELVV